MAVRISADDEAYLLDPSHRHWYHQSIFDRIFVPTRGIQFVLDEKTTIALYCFKTLKISKDFFNRWTPNTLRLCDISEPVQHCTDDTVIVRLQPMWMKIDPDKALDSWFSHEMFPVSKKTGHGIVELMEKCQRLPSCPEQLSSCSQPHKSIMWRQCEDLKLTQLMVVETWMIR